MKRFATHAICVLTGAIIGALVAYTPPAAANMTTVDMLAHMSMSAPAATAGGAKALSSPAVYTVPNDAAAHQLPGATAASAGICTIVIFGDANQANVGGSDVLATTGMKLCTGAGCDSNIVTISSVSGEQVYVRSTASSALRYWLIGSCP